MNGSITRRDFMQDWVPSSVKRLSAVDVNNPSIAAKARLKKLPFDISKLPDRTFFSPQYSTKEMYGFYHIL